MQMTIVLATSLCYCRYTTLWNAGYWACCWRVMSTSLFKRWNWTVYWFDWDIFISSCDCL